MGLGWWDRDPGSSLLEGRVGSSAVAWYLVVGFFCGLCMEGSGESQAVYAENSMVRHGLQKLGEKVGVKGLRQAEVGCVLRRDPVDWGSWGAPWLC